MPCLLAQEAQPQPETPAGGAAPPQDSPWGFLVPILLMWVVIWFVVLRPQKKQEKERQGRVNAIRKGDKVRTKGGVIAPVVRIKDDEIILGLAGDGRAEMVVHKSYIDEVYASSDGAKGKGDEANGK